VKCYVNILLDIIEATVRIARCNNKDSYPTLCNVRIWTFFFILKKYETTILESLEFSADLYVPKDVVPTPIRNIGSPLPSGAASRPRRTESTFNVPERFN